jgi:hypothetical protein
MTGPVSVTLRPAASSSAGSSAPDVEIIDNDSCRSVPGNSGTVSEQRSSTYEDFHGEKPCIYHGKRQGASCKRGRTIESQCSICMDAFDIQDTDTLVCVLPCDHIFHVECARRWVADHNSCPYCKSKVVQSPWMYECTERVYTPHDKKAKKATSDAVIVLVKIVDTYACVRISYIHTYIHTQRCGMNGWMDVLGMRWKIYIYLSD